MAAQQAVSLSVLNPEPDPAKVEQIVSRLVDGYEIPPGWEEAVDIETGYTYNRLIPPAFLDSGLRDGPGVDRGAEAWKEKNRDRTAEAGEGLSRDLDLVLVPPDAVGELPAPPSESPVSTIYGRITLDSPPSY